MKIRIFLMSTLMLLSLQSCNKWLDVTPKDTIAEEDLFKIATGYRNALNGVYKQISSSSLYGRELTWGMSEVLGQNYTNEGFSGISHAYTYLIKYDYKDEKSKSCFEGVWKTAYNSIANCNNIIGRIGNEHSSKFKLGEVEQNAIKGEALALRGFLHFDIIRLFAAAPIVGSDEKYVPYYDKYPSVGESNLGVSEAMEKVIKDLKEAQTLLAPLDTLNQDIRSNLIPRFRFTISSQIASVELFFTHRGYRMNYYAITAMLARAYNYVGEHDLAVAEANKVIEAKDRSTGFSTKLFTFTVFNSSKPDRKMYDDLLFSLSNIKLYDNYLSYYTGSPSGHVTLILKGENDDWSELFDDKADYRLHLLEQKSYDFKPLKNIAPIIPTEESAIGSDMLPVIRMSEMHMIIAESHAAKGDFVSAAASIDAVRSGRNCTKGKLSISNLETFKKEIIRESRREYFGEGQTFFYCKKYNVKPSRAMKNLESFIIPRPESEDIN